MYRIVLKNGVTVECDTPAEVFDLAGQMGLPEPPRSIELSARERDDLEVDEPPPGPATPRPWYLHDVEEFLRRLKSRNFRFFEALLRAETAEQRSPAKIAVSMGLKSGRQLGGVLATITKGAEWHGGRSELMYLRRSELVGEETRHWYELNPQFVPVLRHWIEHRTLEGLALETIAADADSDTTAEEESV